MSTEHACVRCDRPLRHDTALVCSPCANLLRRHLGDVARIAGDITITVARLDKVARTGSGQPDELGWWKNPEALEPVPLPVNLDAAERHDAAVMELATWATSISETRGLDMRLSCGHDSCWTAWELGALYFGPWCAEFERMHRQHPLALLCERITENLDWLRHQPFADEAVPALLAACAELQRIVDTHVPADLSGLCACGTARYSNDRICRRCGAEDLQHTRAAMDEAMANATVTASEAAQWVAYMGLVENTARLRKLIWAWADRGHITPVDDDGPRYRFGDVLRRVLDSPALLRVA